MPSRIEDYALIGDCRTAALIGLDGSIDWLCVPEFDSPACFAALLGDEEHGHWRIGPRDRSHRVRRSYRKDSMVLETEFETSSGKARLTDFMPLDTAHPQIIRIVEGLEGSVDMEMELSLRFDYGSVIPWVRRHDHRIRATAGPDTVFVDADVEMCGEDMRTLSRFAVSPRYSHRFRLAWVPTHDSRPEDLDIDAELERTDRWWRGWAERCSYRGRHRDMVTRSLLTLKAMILQRTGGVAAAVTTSLPEELGGTRNWDYRYCWLRDATFTMNGLVLAGYHDEADAWRAWLVRAVAGTPQQSQIMYGLDGTRRLDEVDLDWLPGYAGSRPVRIGNAASNQFQIDVFGEVLDALHAAARAGLPPDEDSWRVQNAMVRHLETVWTRPDEGIWEVRGGPRQFTHSKVMAWVAFDRAVRCVEHFGLDGDADRWRGVRDRIRTEILDYGFDAESNSFVQCYGEKPVDASLLMLPLVGFLPADDPRMVGTVTRIQRELTHDGLVRRYLPDADLDAQEGKEGTFVLCSFWMVLNLAMQGRRQEAEELFDRLLGLCNDVGLMAEQYSPEEGCMLGNFPQAFSHTALVNAALHLDRGSTGREQRD